MATQSVIRSLQVLEFVSAHQPIGVADLTRLTGLPKSTVQRILVTLAESDWLEPAEGELTRWALGPAARRLGRGDGRETTLREAALGPMHALRDATNETIHLAVSDGPKWMVLIERMDSTQPVRTFNELGTRTPVHATSTGLAVLAYCPPNRVDAVIEGGLESYSPTTITDPGELRAELERIRDRGYTLSLRQYRPQVAAVGSAVLDPTGVPVAGICISMPDSRFRRRHLARWGEEVRQTAEDIGKRLSRNTG